MLKWLAFILALAATPARADDLLRAPLLTNACATAARPDQQGPMWQWQGNVWACQPTGSSTEWRAVNRDALPGDVLPAPAGLYGTVRLARAYSGPALTIIRLSDGAPDGSVSHRIPFAGDVADIDVVQRLCAWDVCRIAIFHDQSGQGHDATARIAPIVTVTDRDGPFHFATVPFEVVPGMRIDIQGRYPNGGCSNQYVAAVEGDIVRANGGCTAPAGTRIMFSAAPRLDPNAMIGPAAGIVFDQIHQTSAPDGAAGQAIVPPTVAAADNAYGMVYLGQVTNTTHGVAPMQFDAASPPGGAALYVQRGFTVLTYRNGPKWNVAYTAADDGFAAPEVWWAAGSAAPGQGATFGVGELSFDGRNNATPEPLRGGGLCASSGNRIDGDYIGGCVAAAFLYGAATPTASQIARIRASFYALLDLTPQGNGTNIKVVGDSLHVYGDNMLSWPLLLAPALSRQGGRINDGAWVGQRNAEWMKSWSRWVDQAFQPKARRNILIISPSGNDYPGGTDCEPHWNSVMRTMLAYAQGEEGHRRWDAVIVLTNPNGTTGSMHAWIESCNAFARDLPPLGPERAGVTVYDLQRQPPFATQGWDRQPGLSTGGSHLSYLTHQAAAAYVGAALLPLLR